jgi:hypothetical protein
MRRLRTALSVLVLSSTILLPASRALASAPAPPFTVYTQDEGAHTYAASDGNGKMFAGADLIVGQGTHGVDSILFTGKVQSVTAASVEMVPPTGSADFVAGTTYATTDTGDAAHPLLKVLFCTSFTGSLTVEQYARDPDTLALTAFAATYHVDCGTQYPTESGEVRWNSTVDYVAAQASVGHLDFGSQPMQVVSTPQPVVVTATGSLPLDLGQARFEVETSGSFVVTSDGCAGVSVAPGDSCTVEVAADPQTPYGARADLVIPDSTPAGRRTVALSESSFSANSHATVTPSYLDFGTVALGQQSASLPALVTSDGAAPIRFGQAFIDLPHPEAYTIAQDTCSGAVLAPGQRCTVRVTATATALGWLYGTVVLPDNNSGMTAIPMDVLGAVPGKGTYYSVNPARLLDTRTGLGATKAALGAGKVIHLQVTGRGGVSANAVSAVVLNVTVTGPTAAGYLTVYPTGAPRPTASSLNFPKGWTGANSVTVPVGTGGKVDIYNFAGSTQVIADVVGYFGADDSILALHGSGGQYYPFQPERLLDTRDGSLGGPLPSHAWVVMSLNFGATDNAHLRAWAVNITAVNPTKSGFFTAWDGYNTMPATSNLNFTPHAVVPNLAIVPTSICSNIQPCQDNPHIAVYNGSSGPTDIVVDLLGVFDDGTLGQGLNFRPITPTRIVDTRTGLGAPHALGRGETATIVTPDGVADAETAALAVNLTAVAPTASTFLTLWPNGPARPTVSTLNARPGQVVPNAAIAMVGANNDFNIYNNDGVTNVLVDVAGTFEAAAPTAASSLSVHSGLTMVSPPQVRMHGAG